MSLAAQFLQDAGAQSCANNLSLADQFKADAGAPLSAPSSVASDQNMMPGITARAIAELQHAITGGDINAQAAGDERVLAGTGRGMANLGRGAAQLVGNESQADLQEAAKLDAPLLATPGGAAGNIIGTTAALLPAAFIPGANTWAGTALVGAGAGALDPIANGNVVGGKSLNAVKGAALSTGLKAAANLASGAYALGKSLIEPFSSSGQENIVGRVLSRFSQDPQTLNTSANAALPGYQQTLAETAQDPGISTLQRAVANSDSQGVLTARDQDNLTAIKDAVGSLGGTDAQRMAAVLARKQATAPLYAQIANSPAEADPSRVINLIDRMVDANPANKALTGPLGEIRDSLFQDFPPADRAAEGWSHLNGRINSETLPQQEWNALAQARTVMTRVKNGSIDPDEALQQLKGIQGAKQSTNDSIDYARQLMKDPDQVLLQSPQALKSAMDNINGMLANPENSTVGRALTLIKNSLGHQINKVEPAYGQANSTFAQMSAPINQMDVGNALADKLMGPLEDGAAQPGVRANAFAQALRNSDRLVKSTTGMNKSLEDVLTPDQLKTLTDSRELLAQRASAQNLARSVGSNTAQNLASQNILRQTAGAIGAPQSFIESQILPTIMRPMNFAMQAQEPSIQQKLSEALLNPAYAKTLLNKGNAPEKIIPMIHALQQYITPAALGANISQQ